MRRSQKSGSRMRRIRRQNRMSRYKIYKIPRQNHLVGIQDLQNLRPKQRYKIQGLQDPFAIIEIKIQDLQDITFKQKLRIKYQQDPRFSGSQDRATFKDPGSAGSQTKWMFRVKDPQDFAAKCQEPWSTGSDSQKYKTQNANFMKTLPNPGNVILSIFWVYGNSVMFCGYINAFLKS